MDFPSGGFPPAGFPPGMSSMPDGFPPGGFPPVGFPPGMGSALDLPTAGFPPGMGSGPAPMLHPGMTGATVSPPPPSGFPEGPLSGVVAPPGMPEGFGVTW